MSAAWQREQPVEITSAMLERAREAIYAQLSGHYGDFSTPSYTETEAILNAALNGGDE